MKREYATLLDGGDLRSTGKANSIARSIKSQREFDLLFQQLFNKDRIIVMRAADAVEKITAAEPRFLKKHKKELLKLTVAALNKELKWHLAQLIPRLSLTKNEAERSFTLLTNWAADKMESKIVRVNALQALHELSGRYKELQMKFRETVSLLKKDTVPSIRARLKKISVNP